MRPLRHLCELVLAAHLCIAPLAATSAVAQSTSAATAPSPLEELYADAEGFGKYSIPVLELKAKKSSYDLSPWSAAKNAAKAQYMEIPVSEAFYRSVRVGEELDGKFNTAKFIGTLGDAERFAITVNKKYHRDSHCVFDGDRCKPVDARTYQALLTLNRQRRDFTPLSADRQLYARSGTETLGLTQNCDLRVRASKVNVTKDVFKHIVNGMNAMHLDLQVPRFLCEGLYPGSTLDRNWVGWSVLLSSSPSQVVFKVTDVKRNY